MFDAAIRLRLSHFGASKMKRREGNTASFRMRTRYISIDMRLLQYSISREQHPIRYLAGSGHRTFAICLDTSHQR